MKKQNIRIPLLFQLFSVFFRIGAFTFGGGYAMIPLIQREAAEKKHWITEDDILEIAAVAESTPGPIAINAATFVGFRTGGFPGALCATLGVVLPSFAVILAVSDFLRELQALQAVQYAFMGVRAGVLALLLRALWSLCRKCPKNALSRCITAAAFILVTFLELPVLPVLIGCAVLGLTASLLAARRNMI